MKFKEYQAHAQTESGPFDIPQTKFGRLLKDSLLEVLDDWQEERDRLRDLLRRYNQGVGNTIKAAYEYGDVADDDFVDTQLESKGFEDDVNDVYVDTALELEEN